MSVSRMHGGRSQKLIERRVTSSKPPSRPAPVKPRTAAPTPPADLKAMPLGKASDEELMRRAQNGDRQAFSLVYERYSSAVLSYLYRMLGNIEDVESIGQEVF